MEFSTQDEKNMKLALELAKKGEGSVSPNPLVGAVIVKNGKVVASGWHKKFGGDHAEIVALKNAKAKKVNVSGSTLYVNLEPCSHFGKTPPCADAIIESGIKKVVIAMKDPNPLVGGKGIKKLIEAGIEVKVGCLKKEAQKLNEKFAKWISTKIPFVAIKFAMSLDGKIATRTGDSKWITSDASRKLVHELRDSYDAILVGRNTVATDNPVLKGIKREPKRIILDSKLVLSPNSNVFRDSNVVVITTSAAPQSKIKLFEKKNISVVVFKDKIDIKPLLKYLGEIGISSVFVEGGSEIFGSFIDSRAVDKVYCFISPQIIGGAGAKTAIAGKGADMVKNALNFNNSSFKQIGQDVLVEASVKSEGFSSAV